MLCILFKYCMRYNKYITEHDLLIIINYIDYILCHIEILHKHHKQVICLLFPS